MMQQLCALPRSASSSELMLTPPSQQTSKLKSELTIRHSFSGDKVRPLRSTHTPTPASSPTPVSAADSPAAAYEEEKRKAESRRRSSLDIVELLATETFRYWMMCFCVVNFDLEIGQALESIYPPTSDLTEQEKKSICFCAFPDSNVFEEGDTVFNFRIRSSACNQKVESASASIYDRQFLYGYVFFRQKKDMSIRRGYYQKSLVMLSHLPFTGLFTRLVSILGPAFCDVGKPMLEAASHTIASWKPPSPGSKYELPFLGQILHVELPDLHKPQLLENTCFDMATLSPDSQVLASTPPASLYLRFRDVLEDLWLCWELMLLGEPVVLVAPSPDVCSEAVMALVDLISPIPYCGDYRPYFTIQDADFKTYVNKGRVPANIILGVTNPFFIKALEHWPNMIRVGNPRSRDVVERMNGTYRHSQQNGGPKTAKQVKQVMGAAMVNAMMRPANSLEFVPGVVSKRKGIVEKDRNLLRLLAEASARGDPPPHIVNNILRRHFAELTKKFLAPLESYFTTLIPTKVTLSSNKQTPRIRPFNQEDFLQTLPDHLPPSHNLPAVRTNIRRSATEQLTALYSQFVKCGNFATWLRVRTEQAEREVRGKYLKALCGLDIARWIQGRQEVEMIDLLLRVKQELNVAERQKASFHEKSDGKLEAFGIEEDGSALYAQKELRLSQRQVEKLQRQAEKIVKKLPKDLRDSLGAGTI
ncbi:uncharacterized protein VTP21DRAFT_6117 [Calcarisporiella thermophila]|uniref:uncharacterized protein n=1 Tax=Calcarisporiella thermophila TaxID=911321 RepID=UPI0037428D85